jgi:hypothetical protein
VTATLALFWSFIFEQPLDSESSCLGLQLK